MSHFFLPNYLFKWIIIPLSTTADGNYGNEGNAPITNGSGGKNGNKKDGNQNASLIPSRADLFSKEICLVQSSNTVFALEDFTLKAERGWGGNDRAGGVGKR